MNYAPERGTGDYDLMFVFPRGNVERRFEFVGVSPGEDAREMTPEEHNEEMRSCQMTYRPKN